MKKYLIIALSLVVLVLPSFVGAAINADLQAQINALVAQIQQLQSQLAQQGGITQRWCYDFNQNLKFGDGGSGALAKEQDIVNLQTALEKEGFQIDDSEKKGGSVFDESTASAVSAFQEKYRSEILTSYRLKYPTGFVGKATRAKLNSLYGCGVIQPISTPTPIPVPVPTPTLVQPSIAVLSPKGGENVKYSDNTQIEYIVNDGINKVSIALYEDDKWHAWIVKDMPINGSGYGTYTWKVSDSITEGQVAYFASKWVPTKPSFKIYMIGYKSAGGTVEDKSNAPFSIVALTTQITTTTPFITPNGNSGSVKIGDTVYIYGQNFDKSSLVEIDGIQTIAASIYSNTQLSFVVPSNLSVGNHSIRVRQIAGYPSINSASLTIVAPTTQNTFSFSQSSFNFSYTQGGNNPLPQPLLFTNTSNVNVDSIISVPNQPPWLNIFYAKAVFTAYPNSTASLWVSVNPSGLSSGTYIANIIISGNFIGSPKTIPVTLTVLAATTPIATTIASSTTVCAGCPAGTGAISFSINIPISVALISPNGGEQWKTGETRRISWKSVNVNNPDLNYDIYIYDSNYIGSGSTIKIASVKNNKNFSDTSGRTYNRYYDYDWTIPSISQLPMGKGSNNFKISIEFKGDYYYNDSSDAPFSIVALTTQGTTTTPFIAPNGNLGSVSITAPKSWKNTTGEGGLGETCNQWLSRTGQAGINGSPAGAINTNGIRLVQPVGNCWYKTSFIYSDPNSNPTDTGSYKYTPGYANGGYGTGDYPYIYPYNNIDDYQYYIPVSSNPNCSICYTQTEQLISVTIPMKNQMASILESASVILRQMLKSLRR
ncbi:MAG: peptidoglycan-binding protein [Patescibacteria group bacterium]